MELKEYIPKAIQGVETLVYTAMAGIGELMQEAVRFDGRDYTWGVGHISDIGASGMYTAMWLMTTNKLKNKLAITLAVPTFLSAWEVVPLLWKGAVTKYDPQDLACYWGAAIAAFGVKEITERAFKNKSQLEKIIEHSEPNYSRSIALN
jgi:hypothetical protein